MNKDPYSPEVTDKSFTELRKFVNWMNKNATSPVIIGGWAVYAYKRGKGSRDIDAIIADNTSIKKMQKFFKSNKYEPEIVSKGTIPMFHTKAIKTKTMEEDDIYFELFSAETKRRDVPGLDLTMKWKWAIDYQQTMQVDRLSLQVPVLELLIVQKIIAALDRKKEMKTLSDIVRAISKVEKDYYDVASLISNSYVDKKLLEKFLSISGANKYIKQFLNGYSHPRNKKSLNDLRISYDKIRKTLI